MVEVGLYPSHLQPLKMQMWHFHAERRRARKPFFISWPPTFKNCITKHEIVYMFCFVSQMGLMQVFVAQSTNHKVYVGNKTYAGQNGLIQMQTNSKFQSLCSGGSHDDMVEMQMSH